MNHPHWQVSYTERFRDEVLEIFEFLKNRESEAIASKFAYAVDEKTRQIEKNPYAFAAEPFLPSKRKIYRKAIVMKRWKIIYRITSRKLTILGIVHTSRHPSVIRQMRGRK